MELTDLTDMDGGKQGGASSLSGQRVLATSGVGNPDAFVRGLRAIGARVVAHQVHGDHHDWTQEDADALAEEAARLSAEVVVTTAKDAVKLAPLLRGAPLRVLRVEMEIDGGEELMDRVLATTSGSSG